VAFTVEKRLSFFGSHMLGVNLFAIQSAPPEFLDKFIRNELEGNHNDSGPCFPRRMGTHGKFPDSDSALATHEFGCG
jgi:hypothetical protein